MILLVIRHGEPVYDPDSLTELGKQQADALAKRLAVHGLDRVFVSPLIRAKMTAEPTCRALGLNWTVEDWMSEEAAWAQMSCVGEDGVRRWLFHQPDFIEHIGDVKALGDRWYEAPCFAARDMKAGYKRITDASDAFLSRLGYVREGWRYRIEKPNEERVACFCHHGFGTTWLSWLLGVSPAALWGNFEINHSGVTVLYFENRPSGYTSPRCICLSDSSHIYAEGLPFYYERRIGL